MFIVTIYTVSITGYTSEDPEFNNPISRMLLCALHFKRWLLKISNFPSFLFNSPAGVHPIQPELQVNPFFVFRYLVTNLNTVIVLSQASIAVWFDGFLCSHGNLLQVYL